MPTSWQNSPIQFRTKLLYILYEKLNLGLTIAGADLCIYLNHTFSTENRSNPLEHCKLCPWKVVRHHIYKMFCWFRSLAGGKSSWLKIHGWSHIPRAVFFFILSFFFFLGGGAFSYCCEKLLSTIQLAVAKNSLDFICDSSDYGLYFRLSALKNNKTTTRWLSFLPRPLSSTTSLHWDYCVRRANINSSVSLQDGWLALKGAVKKSVPSFGASFRRRLLN